MATDRRIILDGLEDKQGRALLVISALYHCHHQFSGIDVLFIDVTSPAVRGAIELLHWETGLAVRAVPDARDCAGASPFEGASLYAAIRFDSTDGLCVTEAARFRVPLLLALQFLRGQATGEHTSEQVSMLRAAHDPAVFAGHLVERMR